MLCLLNRLNFSSGVLAEVCSEFSPSLGERAVAQTVEQTVSARDETSAFHHNSDGSGPKVSEVDGKAPAEFNSSGAG